MLLLGLNIDDTRLPITNSLDELFLKTRNELHPENLENAVTEEELNNDGPSIRKTAENRPAPEGTVSYQLWFDIDKEVRTLEKFYRKFLSSKRVDFSLGELFQVLRYLEVRLQKLHRVVSPRYTVAKVTNTNKNPQTHNVIRAYWYDDEGVEKRSVNKVYNKVEQDFKVRFKPFFEEQGFIVMFDEKVKSGRSTSQHNDLVLLKGDKKFILELKQERCTKLFIRHSLWEIYQEEYNLQY
jgi:hypothetical protein